jgi:hypothetical protein
MTTPARKDVLVVDDDGLTRDALTTTPEAAGYAVRSFWRRTRHRSCIVGLAHRRGRPPTRVGPAGPGF